MGLDHFREGFGLYSRLSVFSSLVADSSVLRAVRVVWVEDRIN